MGKGATLKDADWESFKKVLVPGAALMMMGTPSQVIQAVTEVTTAKFVEDLPEDAQLMLAENLAPGLANLGNTCYMNASVQMMNAMPELQSTLDLYKPAQTADPQTKLTLAMKDLVHQLRTQKTTVMPFLFLTMLRQSFPQFAEQVGGKYLQQCADECWTQMVHCFRRLPAVKTSDSSSSVASTSNASSSSSSSSSSSPSFASHMAANSGIEQLLQGEMVNTTSCLDNTEEMVTTEKETFDMLHCHIDQKISYLFQGVNQGLHTSLVKRSPITNADATYSRTSRIDRLPFYLVVQFLRFEWRPGAKHRSKILRPVEFPFELDALEFCSDDLKASLSAKRELVKQRNDTPADQPKPTIEQAPMRNETGFYELAAVLTHMGRDADGGHYVSWVRQEGDKWLLFDDDKVSGATPEDIKKLYGYGGADWHMAFLCLYRTKQFK